MSINEYMLINKLYTYSPILFFSGEALGFENLVYSVFEFVQVLIDTSKFRTLVKKSINDILYYVIIYMQMTDDQVRILYKACYGYLKGENNLI